MKRLILATLLAGCTAFPAAAQDVTITNARLVLGDGSAPVEGGTVVIRGGRVVSAGRGAAAAGGKTIDAGGRYVTPGIVAGFTRLGIVEVDGVGPTNDASARESVFNAGLDVTAGLNPRATPIAINRTDGVTRAVVAPDNGGSIFAGQGAVIDLGNDMDAVTRPRAFQFMEWGEAGARAAGGSRPAAMAMFRNALFEAQAYGRNPAGFADRGKEALLTRADALALQDVLSGKVPLLIHVERASDILGVLALKREFAGLKPVLVGAAEGWTVAQQIAAAGVPVLASALADLPASFEQLAATQSNIGRMKAAGVTVGIGMIGDDESRQARLVRQYAGNLVALSKIPGAAGLDWGAAFATITSLPARAIGMDGEIGTLGAGRRGDVVIWDGDPLEIGSVPTQLFIDGVEQPLTNRQTRLRDRYLVPQEQGLPKAYQR
ncbi:amidohydrolase [Sphingomonas sp. Leaf24]|uniref:amidohydrolase family protein n=1 Tax=unclassified Sphingomonas TaxID=196159 RepID=UPI0006F66F06|nr:MULTISPECIES: amidohydrolase family protein [unclassified Sphingomonas]KQM23073.1 amidohydrolase [Sphingomonas sp. Leaf5]KQM95931.1 amidohydrolase [Sphingomonas sp. Leaf24]